MNYQMPMQNGMGPFQPFQNMPPVAFQSSSMMQMPGMQGMQDNLGTSLNDRINMLEQKMQSVENRLKKLEKGATSEQDGFYQYKNSMYMM